MKAKELIDTVINRVDSTEGTLRSTLVKMKDRREVVQPKYGHYDLPNRESTYGKGRDIAEGAVGEALGEENNINYKEEGPMEPGEGKLKKAFGHIAYEVRDGKTGEVQLQIEFVVRVGETQERTVSLG